MKNKMLLLIPMALAAACSHYDIYKIRSEVSEALADRAVSSLKLGVTELWVMDNRLPADLADLKQSLSSTFPEPGPDGPIGDLRIENGTIILKFSGNGVSEMKGEVLAMALCAQEGTYAPRWACGHGSCPAGSSVRGPNPNALTTLSPEVMPVGCR